MCFPFKFEYIIIEPSSGDSISDQLSDCIGQYELLIKSQRAGFNVVRLSWFYDISELDKGISLSRLINDSMPDKNMPVCAQTFIPQKPLNGNHVELLVLGVQSEGECGMRNNQLGGISFQMVESTDMKWLFFGGTGSDGDSRQTKGAAEKVFNNLSEVLKWENLSYKHLLRQWNYIGGILEITELTGAVCQNYQEFNDARGLRYHQEGLMNNFPAATGIGISGKSVILEGIALEADSQTQVFSLHNPVQQDAHRYSNDRLIGSEVESTPLFERGKVVFSHGQGHIWVSGTAAIRGENSIKGNTQDQTKLTCDIIDLLVSNENLVEAGLPPKDYIVEAVYLRAYVKYLGDGEYVRRYLKERYADIPIHALQADVCRDELLVEIEAELSVQ